MGCILSAASCNKWWMEEILHTQEFTNEQDGLESYLGDNEVFFLPYLMGERSPHNDVNARGCFIGMRPDTTRKQMTLAVMEGVAFALRDCIEVAKSSGLTISATSVCGGGAKSDTWKKIISNVFGVPVYALNMQEGPAYGAAMLAMVGTKEYDSLEEIADKFITVQTVVHPQVELIKKYERRYRYFKKLYPALKSVFAQVE